ncbi:hypothetical protein LCGC14_0980250 [marine sediment metagenome]|uniref:Uncharacterized protein n=1 Tax=marine sediment metagenome TaxID=412755 RepID=A0A0F9N8Z0_9ZZZZ
MALTVAELEADIALVGGFDPDDESADIAKYRLAGLRAIARAGAWTWLRKSFSFTMEDDVYQYDMTDSTYNMDDLFRLDTKSIRSSGSTTVLTWRTLTQIDARLGPQWKDDDTDATQPIQATRVGNELWLAPKPGTEFIAATPTLHGYGWRREPTSGNLYIPEEFSQFAVNAALAFGLRADDDPEWREFFKIFQENILEMRGTTLNVGELDKVESPDWSTYDYDGWDSGDYYPSY